VLKLRYIAGDITPELESKLLQLTPYHVSKELTWKDIYHHTLIYSQDAIQPNSAELKHVFTHILTTLIDVIIQRPMIFETYNHQIIVSANSTINWTKVDKFGQLLLPLAFIKPSEICDNPVIFQIYTDIEDGDFSTLTTYLIQVQLHIRIRLHELPSVAISNICESKRDELYMMFQYPKSLYTDITDNVKLQRCDIKLDDATYVVTLPDYIISRLSLNNQQV
jgi:hypothetical protein